METKSKSIAWAIAGLLCIISSISYSQTKFEKIDNYQAPNGITYKPGDKITLGKGSDADGKFVYVNETNVSNDKTETKSKRLVADVAGSEYVIKTIYRYYTEDNESIFFMTEANEMGQYQIDFKNAYETCEIVPCKKE